MARTTGLYVLLDALSAILVLFPIYMTIVRALSTPVGYINARAARSTRSTSSGTSSATAFTSRATSAGRMLLCRP